MSMMVKVTIGEKTYEYEKGTKIEKILEDVTTDKEAVIALATIGNKLVELNKPVNEDCDLGFLGLDTANGMRTYKRSAIFVMQKAINKIAPDMNLNVRVLHSLGDAFYCDISGGMEITAEFVEKIKEAMTELVANDLPILKRSIKTHEAKEIFEKHGMDSKAKLFKYRINSNANIYDLDGTIDYFYGYMVPSTGYIKYFDLEVYDKGMVIKFPSTQNPKAVAEFKPLKKLYGVLKESTGWSNLMDIPTIAELNDSVCSGKTREIILFQEALMEGKLAAMAKDIANRPTVPKFIMIAGPSSSGKTTFSHRLSTQLRACGLKPHPVPLDDFFINRDDVPLDEYGEKDFESLYAVDIKRFNDDMTSLLAGKETELPVYDFLTGKRKTVGRKMQLGPEDVLVIEGIHGLNDELSYTLPKESKYKIYISALNVLSIDEHNPLSSSDCRLLRRIVRDARVRGYDAQKTIAMWPSVQRGERKNIFPFQEEADVLFNSALIYEMAVIALYAKPLLFSIDKDAPEYKEANRLLKFLNYIVPIPTDDIPNNSLIREFIGGGCFGV